MLFAFCRCPQGPDRSIPTRACLRDDKPRRKREKKKERKTKAQNRLVVVSHLGTYLYHTAFATTTMTPCRIGTSRTGQGETSPRRELKRGEAGLGFSYAWVATVIVGVGLILESEEETIGARSCTRGRNLYVYVCGVHEYKSIMA